MMLRRTATWIASVLALTLVGVLLLAPVERATAVTGSEFDPGFIISDRVFFNSATMSGPQVQAFLEGMTPTCANANGWPCLKAYTESTPNREASSNGQCGAYPGAVSEPASFIVVKVAQVCGINPQVLLATLQKERGLITKTSPTLADYRVAMGYGCPDTAACDTQYYGFFNQVYRAAQQFKTYTIFPRSFTYRVGNVAVQYKPNTTCGAPVVNIRNQATANLYNYTPYQPNAAALANLNGLGDACSSYGNRNFWVYFNNWFGSSVGDINPRGSIDLVATSPGKVRIAGWVFDPDSKDPIEAHVYINGVGTATLANASRPDVDSVFGGVGANHGFDITVPAVPGPTQNVCLYAINTGPGASVLVRCLDVASPTGSPVGRVDSVVGSVGQVTVTGWAIDPDTADPIDVHVYVDGAPTVSNAGLARSDIASAFPGYGQPHGFAVNVPVGGGTHQICVYGINRGAGGNVLINCSTVTTPGGSPVGVLDSVTVAGAAVQAFGWAIDPDTAAPIAVHLYLDGASWAYTANRDRPDVARVFGAYGPAHGFLESLPAAPGRHTICAYGINAVGAGGNPLLGCKQIVV